MNYEIAKTEQKFICWDLVIITKSFQNLILQEPKNIILEYSKYENNLL